ncbi:uncharacterized protein EDB91DRAFT_1177162 [Suillus paluster]|uniref:uncharacterized protein n=1 Tax=Suillus paluster TaxID=48578 RepID=UPI001B8667BC|nr:uncharacterized protein EDB91DRAFT_1177162 [Suillus paluster]KAG1720828.1 hypothetical protein EDB91DRAFT_1177162 [Suillus paluster]
MKKLFGRDKAKQQKVTSHRDADVVIDDDAPPMRPPRPSEDHRDWEMLSDPPVPSSPYPQFAVPPTIPSRSSSLASLPPIRHRSHCPHPQTNNPNPTHTVRRDGRKIQKAQPAPAVLGILKSLDPHLDLALQHSHSHHGHEVSDDYRDRAEKKERKSFWDGIMRDRDRDKDKDRERGRDKERETREKEKEREKEREREKDKERIWREEDNPSELTRMIGYLTATSSEDWTLVLEVCERASSNEANAKEAMKALRREFKYAEPKSQLSAARLWAIMLRNASDIFLTQISSRKFIDTLEDVLISSRTSPVVRERLMEVLAAAAFITSSRPHPSPKSEPSPFSLKDRDRDRDGFRALWTRLKPADKPDVGIPFDTEDAMFSPPIVPTRPPIGERPSRKSLHQRGVIPPEEDMKRLFQECKIAKGNANVLCELLTYTKPEADRREPNTGTCDLSEFLSKCRASQELIYTQIPWASAGAERSRLDRERNAEGNGRTKSQLDLQFSSPPSRDYHGGDAKLYNADGEEQTAEEELLGALLEANEALFGAMRMYDDAMRVAEERVAVEISRRDVKMDRRHIENEYLGESHHDYGGSSRTPSPMPSPPGSPRPRSPAFPSRPPSPDRGGLVRASRGNSLESMGGALERLHMEDNDVDEEEVTSPIRPSAKALGKRRVVEEAEDEQYDSSDLYYEPRRESVALDSDEETRGGDHANALWGRPTQYVYDAAAERTAQHLREGRVNVAVNGVH